MTALPTASPEDVGLSSVALDRLSTALKDRVAAGHVPGAVALVARHGKIAYHQAFGAVAPGGAPMTTDAIFRIYSMTKPIVSVAVMMLWEEGRVLLTDPISKYMPEFASMNVGVENPVAAKRAITVQDLLRHTSGLTYEFRGNGPVHRAYGAARVARLKQTNADHVATLASLPLLHQPGAHWEYSRSTDVLGRLVEVVSGQTLGAFLSERILNPLGMTETAFSVPEKDHARIAEPFAVPAPPAPDLWPGLEALGSLPLLLVRGGLSDILSAATLAEMAGRAPSARALTLADTGHAPTLDEPEARAAIASLLEAVR